jgi:hypothetical protein
MSQCKTEAEKKELKELMKVCQPLLEAILKAIESDLEELDVVDWKDFKNPSWAFERAAKDGYKKGLTKLKEYVII